MHQQFDYLNIVRDAVSLLHMLGRLAVARERTESMQMADQSQKGFGAGCLRTHVTLAEVDLTGSA